MGRSPQNPSWPDGIDISDLSAAKEAGTYREVPDYMSPDDLQLKPTARLMDLRDHFAGQALAGLLTNDDVYKRTDDSVFADVVTALSYQIADANHGAGAKTIKSLSFRLDHREFDINYGMGRTWANVQVAMSECNQSTISWNFSNNSLGRTGGRFARPRECHRHCRRHDAAYGVGV